MPVNHPRMRVAVRVADVAHFALTRYPEPFTAADAAEACDCSPEVAGYVLWGGYPPGRAAIVTGAGSGIGRATALRLAREGTTVVAADISTSQLSELGRNRD